MPTKSAIKKKVTKKPTKKAAARRTKVAATVCGCEQACRPEQSFWVNNGPVVDSVSGLREAIKAMNDDQYRYHTERSGNDFASWIRWCVGDAKLADRIVAAKSRADVVRILAACCK